MALECKIVTQFSAENVWTRIAPHPQRLKEGLPHCWRFHVEKEKEIFLIDEFHMNILGPLAKDNGYSQPDTSSTTGMTAWIRSFGDVTIETKPNGSIIATITLKEPNANSA